MRTWTADTWLAGEPDDVLELLTEPEAIARWSPVPFELVDCETTRLLAGTRARVRGELAGRGLQFDVDVHEASAARLALVAQGPIDIDVEYRLAPLDCGSQLQAAVSVSGRGLLGGLLARAVETLLAGGALQHALRRISAQLEPAPVPALA
jgi:hypothetical protein